MAPPSQQQIAAFQPGFDADFNRSMNMPMSSPAPVTVIPNVDIKEADDDKPKNIEEVKSRL